MQKKISFLALNATFDFDQIGGTDSYMRRLTSMILELGIEVEWVFYGAKNYSRDSCQGVKIIKYGLFNDALKYIESTDTNYLISCFLKPIDRFKLLKYRLPFKKNNFKLFSLSFFYPETVLKKTLRKIELCLVQYNGVLCVSKRLYDFNAGISHNVHYLPPIIPKSYFEIGYDKASNSAVTENSNLRALFLGRLDPRKGINEVISVIESVELTKNIEWSVSGIYIPEDDGNVAALQRLKSCQSVKFHEESRSSYSLKVESRVLSYFTHNDVFLQPYRSLASTVDLPLLLLEAQAAGCIVLTTLPEILNDYLYDKSEAIADKFVEKSVCLLNQYTSISTNYCITNEALQELELEYSEDAIENRLKGILNV